MRRVQIAQIGKTHGKEALKDDVIIDGFELAMKMYSDNSILEIYYSKKITSLKLL
jgi:hypothetical protein